VFRFEVRFWLLGSRFVVRRSPFIFGVLGSRFQNSEPRTANPEQRTEPRIENRELNPEPEHEPRSENTEV
jgi:hypothetical protein